MQVIIVIIMLSRLICSHVPGRGSDWFQFDIFAFKSTALQMQAHDEGLVAPLASILKASSLFPSCQAEAIASRLETIAIGNL